MAKRNIIKIDEEKCDGCRQCVTACAEGAIQIIDGKAKLVSEVYCDGLGACLGHCPQDAITIEQREAEQFDEEATKEYLARKKSPLKLDFACPGLMSKKFDPADDKEDVKSSPSPSRLGQWPVQLKLVSPMAEYFANSDFLWVADCVPLAMGDFHEKFLKGRSVAMGCPKLDDSEAYIDKLAEIIKANNLKSFTVVHMEVPCCSGLTRIAKEAIIRSEKAMSFEDVTISLRGNIIETETIKI